MSPSNASGPVIPRFARGSARIQDAYLFAREVHEGPRRRSDTTIAHPAAVAELLHDAGYPDHVVVAALLHDVVEDTAADIGELRRRFGSDVARMVADLTEDPAIESYAQRKGDLRERAVADGRFVAAVFAADKLASARFLNSGDALPPPEKLEHYERTLRVVQDRHPGLPFVAELEDELTRLRSRSSA